MKSIHCHVDLGYWLSICSRTEGNHGKTWIWGTGSAFALRLRDTTGNLGRVGRSQTAFWHAVRLSDDRTVRPVRTCALQTICTNTGIAQGRVTERVGNLAAALYIDIHTQTSAAHTIKMF